MILLKNAKIADGGGGEPTTGDILVKDDRIMAIGSFPRQNAETTIDCLGIHTVTPGIIDVNTDSDHYLTIFTHPDQTDFLLQGVTSIIGGHCGASLAPLISGSLESIQKWAGSDSVNVDWRSLGEFLRVLNQLETGVNFGTLVGHATVRRAILGNADRELSKNEIGIFKYVLEEALREGAFGLSTGLQYSHSKHTPYEELRELAKVVRTHNGVYTTHLRDEKEHLIQAFEETEQLMNDTNVSVMIDHLRPLKGFEGEYREVINRIENQNPKENFYFNISPFDTSLVSIYTLLPEWAQAGGFDGILKTLEDEKNRERIVKELRGLQWDDMVIAQAPKNTFIVGQTLTEFAKSIGANASKALIELMISTRLRAIILYRNVNSDLISDAVMMNHAIPASNSAATPQRSENMVRLDRSTKTFPKFIEIASQKGLPLYSAIRKITSLPAQVFHIPNRGVIRKGDYADLVVWKDNKADAVIVNGKIAVKEGMPTGVRGGRALRPEQE